MRANDHKLRFGDVKAKLNCFWPTIEVYKLQPEILMLVSSASMFAQAVVRQFGSSFMYIKKSKG